MNEIIKKIDVEIEHHDISVKQPISNKDYHQFVKHGLELAKQIIQSEHKEPCKYCENEILTVKMEFGYDSYMGKDGWVSSTRHPKVCPMCDRLLNQKAKEE